LEKEQTTSSLSITFNVNSLLGNQRNTISISFNYRYYIHTRIQRTGCGKDGIKSNKGTAGVKEREFIVVQGRNGQVGRPNLAIFGSTLSQGLSVISNEGEKML